MAESRHLRVMMVGPAVTAVGGVSAVEAFIIDTLGERVRFTVVSTVANGGAMMRLLQSGAGVAEALVRLLFEAPDVVHLHLASNGSFHRKRLIAAAARRLDRPYIVHLHGGRFNDFYEQSSTFQRRAIVRLFEDAQSVLVLGEHWRLFVTGIAPGARVSVVPNPAVIEQEPSDADARRILFVGRVGMQKGADTLLIAFARLHNRFPDWELVLAGEVEPGFALPEDRRGVIVQGVCDKNQLRLLRHSSSVFCLPSRAEGLPLSLLDAMGSGMCCVVTEVGAIGEHIRDAENGLFVPPGDHLALERALVAVITQPKLRAALGSLAREHVLSCCSRETIAVKILSEYERCSV